MPLNQPDLFGSSKILSGEPALAEFEEIFGFPADIISNSVVNSIRAVNETDSLHTQLSAEGSRFYHSLVEQFRTSVDAVEGWSANRTDDNSTSPRAHRADGLTLGVAQGNNATGYGDKVLKLRRPLGPVTLKELRGGNGSQQLELALDDRWGMAVVPRRLFWFFLYRRVGETVYVEVAQPSDINDDGKVAGWEERIILDDISMNGWSVGIKDDGYDDGDDGIGVAISAR